jgi:hypothetical protein
MGWIGKFLPNLIPGLGLFANPWVLLALLAALVGSFLFGVHLEAGRFEAFQEQVKIAGEAQTQRAVSRNKASAQLKKDKEREYKATVDKLADSIVGLQRELLANTGSGYVSGRQQPEGSKCPDGQRCFDAAEFDSAIRAGFAGTQRFAEATARIAGEGETLGLKLDTSVKWMGEQRKLK